MYTSAQSQAVYSDKTATEGSEYMSACAAED